jgi:hypothetical protein
MLPQEIGAAAAYEAYRQIKYGHSMFQFLHSDYERQREALRGLAVAEGKHATMIRCPSLLTLT